MRRGGTRELGIVMEPGTFGKDGKELEGLG